MRAFHPVRLTRYRLSFDGATISRVQLNLTNFHGRGLIGFINYMHYSGYRGSAAENAAALLSRALVRGRVAGLRAPFLEPQLFLLSRFRSARSRETIEATDRRLVRRMRCKAYMGCVPIFRIC